MFLPTTPEIIPWTLTRDYVWHFTVTRFSSIQFSHSVMSDSLQPHGLQHARPPCPSPAPGGYPNSCPLCRWCQPTVSSCSPFLLLPSVFPSIRIFSNESTLPIRWPKYWSSSFSISPSSEYSGLISFRIDWFDLLAVQGILESSPVPQFKSITSSMFSLLYGLTLTSVHDYQKDHRFDYTDLCQQSNVSAF